MITEGEMVVKESQRQLSIGVRSCKIKLKIKECLSRCGNMVYEITEKRKRLPYYNLFYKQGVLLMIKDKIKQLLFPQLEKPKEKQVEFLSGTFSEKDQLSPGYFNFRKSKIF